MMCRLHVAAKRSPDRRLNLCAPQAIALELEDGISRWSGEALITELGVPNMEGDNAPRALPYLNQQTLSCDSLSNQSNPPTHQEKSDA